MNRIYTVKHHIDYEGFNIIAVFNNRKEANILRDSLAKKAGQWDGHYVVDGYAICSTANQSHKHQCKRRLANRLNWLRAILREKCQRTTPRISEWLEEYKDLL